MAANFWIATLAALKNACAQVREFAAARARPAYAEASFGFGETS